MAMILRLVAVLAAAAASVDVDVIVVGGGIAGLSVARAAVTTSKLTVQVIEQGTVCGQGATAAAKQGHVTVPDGAQSSPLISDYYRVASLQLYQEATAAGYDVGLRQTGTARPYVADSTFDRFTVEAELRAYRAGLSALYDTRIMGSDELENQHNIHGSVGALWDDGGGAVNPCKVLAAYRAIVEAAGSAVEENAIISKIIAPVASDDLYTVTVRHSDGTTSAIRARALVVAVGVWHNAFMETHFAACTDKGPDVRAVAGQIAIYQRGVPLPTTPQTIFSYSPGAALNELQPYAGGALQPPGLEACRAYSPNYFLTSCNGSTWSRYLYATSCVLRRRSMRSR